MPEDNFPVNEKWELWYQDQFDWDCPRKVEVRGKGIMNGLRILWQYHLQESITPEGQPGFSKFNLWLPTLKRSIEISAESSRMAKIRDWVLGLGTSVPDPSWGDNSLLDLIAQAHYYLVVGDQNEDEIVEMAAGSEDGIEFSRKLSGLIDQD
jgi:hypothetical protein